jgi:tetratricopeptide (TPR) repeat protein
MKTTDRARVGGIFGKRTAIRGAAFLLAGCASVAAPSPVGPRRDAIDSETAILAIDFSSDSNYFCRLLKNGDVFIRDVLRDTNVSKQSYRDQIASELAVGRGGRFAVVDQDGVQVGGLSGHLTTIPASGKVRFVTFDDSANLLAVATEDGFVAVYDVRSGQELKTISPVTGSRVLRGPDFGVLYLLDGSVRVLGLGPNGMDVTLDFPRDDEVPIAITPDGRRLAAVSLVGPVEVRDLPSGKVVSKLTKLTADPVSMAISPDGSVLAVDYGAGAIELWDVMKDERIDRFESSLMPSTLTFSPNGYILAWVEEEQTKVRFWSLGEGVIEWQSGGPTLIEKARAVCDDLALIIRYRRATGPFERGTSHFQAGMLVDAIREFRLAGSVLPTYPGLAAATREAEGLHEANLRVPVLLFELERHEARGEYREALEKVEEFLRDYGRYGHYGFGQRAATLRTLLQHWEAAQAHRKAGRDVDAVLEFELAVGVLPSIAELNPEYAEIRERLEHQLAALGAGAAQRSDHVGLLEAYGELQRLRPLVELERLQVGIAHENLGHRQEALQSYYSIPEEVPEYVDARQGLARIARAAGSLKVAREELERARAVTEERVDLERDYAEICELLGDFDVAVVAWTRVAALEPTETGSLETIARIESERGAWERAGRALRLAVERSKDPKPKLLIEVAKAYEQAGIKPEILAAYVDLLDIVNAGNVEVPWLGEHPARRVKNWIREIGYVRRRMDWITRDQFLIEQGWVLHDKEWLRPEEVQLHDVATRFESPEEDGLRTMTDEEYAAEVAEQRVAKGMTREEVIRAWGFFQDQNVFSPEDADAEYEQLLYSAGKQVYLRDGEVCFWSE